MLSYLAYLEDVWGPFRLFGYISFRAVMAVLTAMVIGFVLAPSLFNKLRKLKASQGMRDADHVGRLAELHAVKKDTPTMGGLLIFLGIVPSVLLWAKPNVYVLSALVVYIGLSIIGFLDDYLKITKKNADGLNSKWKLAAQTFLTCAVMVLLLGNVDSHLIMSQLWVPFLKAPLIQEMPIAMIFIFFFFVMAGTSNGLNLTDGVDGLATGCTIPVVLVYAVIAYSGGHALIADYLNRSFIPGVGELSIVCAAIMGAALVFLWYNAHPAEVFMGDTGSLSLGGVIGTIAFITHEPFTLVLVGGIFVLETLSVIIQIITVKRFNFRFFKMTPIHHHFELKGWHENKVVIRFWILSLMFALIGLVTLKLR